MNTLSTPPRYQWTQITDSAAFAARDGAGALTFQDRMWLIGGWNSADKVNFPVDCVNDVWSSKNGRDWSQQKLNTFGTDAFDAANDWEGRHTAGYVVHRNKMWIVGGDPLQKHYQDNVWTSTDGTHWTNVTAGRTVPWGPRVLHYTVAFRGHIWVIGGQTMPQFAPAPECFYRDIWKSADGVSWKQVIPEEPFWPQRGMIGGTAVFQDRIWILGGGTYDTPEHPQRKYFNDVWSSADGIHWNHHPDAPWMPRQYHDVAVFDDKLWVMEGCYNAAADGSLPTNRKDVWYSGDGETWTELPNTPWKERHAASVFVFENALWMVAGNNMESDVWKLIRTT